mmetsp:Transcript_86197/g.136063  ORF Transcript_86197/g.136063 Transcript_86197/m.136063 type:complete len:178 (-) Transcript_86197:91-624(-)
MDGTPLPLALRQERGDIPRVLEETEMPPEESVEELSVPLEFRMAWVGESDKPAIKEEVIEYNPYPGVILPSVEIVFWFKGDDYPFQLLRRPLGITWWKRNPVTVTEVAKDGYGNELGIRKGFQVKFVNGISCTGKPYAFVAQTFDEAVKKLPLVTNAAKKSRFQALVNSVTGSSLTQ